MDQPGLALREHRHALTALGRAHRVSRTAAALWPAIRRAAGTSGGAPLRVLDVASGGGQLAIALARHAARERVPLDIVCGDISPVAIEYGRGLAARAGVQGIRFQHLDVLNGSWPDRTDVVVSTLFLHHLDEDQAVAALQRMRAVAERLVLVSDLRRSRLGWLFAWVGCRLLSRSRVFHVDGTRSVEAAFTIDEARRLAERAGLVGARITNRWPQRWQLEWTRTVS
jgi:2-polyprenyl-3-methyl-5-hydroxy-6-metoxy-1,4-benzoquinol methylase